MEEKQTFIKWVKAHKKELVVAGVSVAALIGIIVGVKHKDSILALWVSLKKDVVELPIKGAGESMPMAESISETKIIEFPVHRNLQNPFDVYDHIRNLPNGNHASIEKRASAAEHGYTLQPGQTWVEGYVKGGNAV